MKGLKSFAFVFLLFSSAVYAERIPTVTGDYCQDDINAYLGQKFGIAPSDIQIHYFAVFGSWYISAFTSVCQGEFRFEGMGSLNFYDCRSPQYISRTHFLRRVHAFADCQKLLPDDDFPRS